MYSASARSIGKWGKEDVTISLTELCLIWFSLNDLKVRAMLRNFWGSPSCRPRVPPGGGGRGGGHWDNSIGWPLWVLGERSEISDADVEANAMDDCGGAWLPTHTQNKSIDFELMHGPLCQNVLEDNEKPVGCHLLSAPAARSLLRNIVNTLRLGSPATCNVKRFLLHE